MRLLALILSLVFCLLLAPCALADDCCAGTDERASDQPTSSTHQPPVSSDEPALPRASCAESPILLPCCTDVLICRYCVCGTPPANAIVESPARSPLREHCEVLTATLMGVSSFPTITARAVEHQLPPWSRRSDHLVRLQL